MFDIPGDVVIGFTDVSVTFRVLGLDDVVSVIMLPTVIGPIVHDLPIPVNGVVSEPSGAILH